MAGSVLVDVAGGQVRRLIRAAIPVGASPASGGEGNPTNDPYGDPHGIAPDTWDVLLRPGSAERMVQSSTDGVSWSADATLQAEVNLRAAGTKFKFTGAVFRRLSAVSKADNHYMGHEGGTTDLTGAMDLGTSGWVASGGQWYREITVAMQARDTNSAMADGTGQIPAEDNQRDQWCEDLWVDDVRWRHLDTKANVNATGDFYIEYDTPSTGTHRVWIGVDPSTLGTVELAVQPWLLVGGSGTGSVVTGVTVELLTWRRYATIDESGAIGGGRAVSASGSGASTWGNLACEGWTLRYVHGTECHAGNLKGGPGWTLEHVNLTHAGQIGMHANCGPGQWTPTSRSITITDLRVGNCCELTFDWGNSGGGFKILGCYDGCTLTNALGVNNDGAAFWWDYPHGQITATRLKAEDNVGWGARIEVMDDVTSSTPSVVQGEFNRNGNPTDSSLDGNSGSDGIGHHAVKVINGRYIDVTAWGSDNAKGVQLQTRNGDRSIAVRALDCDLAAGGTLFLYSNIEVNSPLQHDVTFVDCTARVASAATNMHADAGAAYTTTANRTSTQWAAEAFVTGFTIDTGGGTPGPPAGVEVFAAAQFGPFALAA